MERLYQFGAYPCPTLKGCVFAPCVLVLSRVVYWPEADEEC